jgi:mono/diheme cytochrome c family protein
MRAPLVIAAVLLAAGCASTPRPGPAVSGPSAFALSGAEIARTKCAACHAIDGPGPSPRPSAPPFPTLRIRFNQLTWERTMAEIAAGGHDEMPPVSLSDSEIRDLKAFIDGLR